MLLAVALIVSFPTTVFAQEQEDGNVFVNEEYGYTITKQETPEGSEIRTYENPNASAMKKAIDMGRSLYGDKIEIPEDEKYEYIKSVLADVGFAPKAIASYDAEDFEEYCASDFIQASTSYYKVDDEGNQEQVNYDEIPEVVLTGANTGARGGITDDSTFYDEVYDIDSYFSLRLTVNYVATGAYDNCGYKYTAAASWINEPTVRLTDSLSIGVKNSTIVPSTVEAWYSYDITTEYVTSIFQLEPYYATGREYIDIEELSWGSQGKWDACGMSFCYPTDSNETIYRENMIIFSKSYQDFFAYMEFVAQIDLPNTAVIFNAMSAYEQLVYTVQVAPPSLNINAGLGGGIYLGLSITVQETKSTTMVIFPENLYYEPR